MNSKKFKFPIGNKKFISAAMASFLILGTIGGGQTTYADNQDEKGTENVTTSENLNAKEDKSEKAKLDSSVETKENKSTKEISEDLLKASKNMALNQSPTQISNFSVTVKTRDGKVLNAGSAEQITGQEVKFEEVRMHFTITQDGTLTNGTEIRIPVELVNIDGAYDTHIGNLSSGILEQVAGVGTFRFDSTSNNFAYVLTINQGFVDSVPNGAQKTVEIVQRANEYGGFSPKLSSSDMILTINGSKFTFKTEKRKIKKATGNFYVKNKAFSAESNSITLMNLTLDYNYYNNMLESDGKNPGETGIPDGDIITIHNVKANPGSKIVGVNILNPQRYTSTLSLSEDGRYFVFGDTSSSLRINTDPQHKSITLPENATKEDIFKALKQAGKNSSVIIKKGENDYVVAINLGKMKGPEATTYHDIWSSDDFATSTDKFQEINRTKEVNKRVDKILKNMVVIHSVGLNTRITFADPSISNSLSADSHSYSYAVNDQGVGTEILNTPLKSQTTPSNSSVTGQQKITVYHLDTEGNELDTQDYAYGYPAGSPIVQATPDFNAAVKTIPGYKLLTTAPANPITTVNGTQLTTAKSIPFTNDDQVFYYVYTPNTQKVTYTVIDETEQKTLEDKKPLVSGPSNSNLSNDTQAKYQGIIDGYMDKYELVNSDMLPAKFDRDDNVDQNVVIHLRHKTTSVEETKKVSLTINYSGAGDKTPASHVEEATWTRTVTTDKVTGAVTDNGTWVSDKAKYAKVTSPVIDGYTADVLVVEEETVTQDNIVKEVKYTAKTVVPNNPGNNNNNPGNDNNNPGNGNNNPGNNNNNPGNNNNNPGNDNNNPENGNNNPGNDNNNPGNNEKPDNRTAIKSKLAKTGIASASLASAIAAFGALSTVVVFRRKKNSK